MIVSNGLGRKAVSKTGIVTDGLGLFGAVVYAARKVRTVFVSSEPPFSLEDPTLVNNRFVIKVVSAPIYVFATSKGVKAD